MFHFKTHPHRKLALGFLCFIAVCEYLITGKFDNTIGVVIALGAILFYENVLEKK
jgi:hypothetical protein